jgi:FixJ family two-component response regulator
MSNRHNSRLVAIVDDDDSVQSALQDLIESDGASALCFGSARQFLDSEARYKAACLIADIRMPGMSGLELQAKLNADGRKIPIIFITAHGDAKLRTLAMDDGAVEFLAKPFNDAALLEVVRGVLESEETTALGHRQVYGGAENQYATCEDFLKIFDQDINGLYQLSFLLTRDHLKAGSCFVAGFEDCAEGSRVFREWARAWAKRMIILNVIRELNPRPGRSNSPAFPNGSFPKQESKGLIKHFDVDSVLRLGDFERFVFVLCVLEHYREHECALLLGCSASEVRDARTRAIEKLAEFDQVVPNAMKIVVAVGNHKHSK